MKLGALWLCVAGFAGMVHAAAFCTVVPGTWCEVGTGDAGTLPSTAELTIGSGALDFIIGKLSNGTAGADIYEIYISDPATFSASYSGYAKNGTAADDGAALYLFDVNGDGIEAVDDGLAALGAFTGAAGIYFVDVAPDGNDPEYKKSGNSFAIFNPFSSGSALPVGGAGPIKDYTKDGCGTDCEGGYEISFTGGGVQYAATPEPTTIALTGLALGALGLMRRKRA